MDVILGLLGLWASIWATRRGTHAVRREFDAASVTHAPSRRNAPSSGAQRRAAAEDAAFIDGALLAHYWHDDHDAFNYGDAYAGDDDWDE